jgi:hypothetical protein
VQTLIVQNLQKRSSGTGCINNKKGHALARKVSLLEERKAGGKVKGKSRLEQARRITFFDLPNLKNLE